MRHCKPETDTLAVIVLAGGGLGHVSGGVGTLMGYLLDAWAARPDRPQVQVIDTRGESGRLAGAACFLRALARLVWLAASGRADLVHAHMTTRGSVLRKSLLCGAASLFRVPFVLHMHGADFVAFHAALPAFVRAVLRRVLRSATRVIVLGDGWRDFLVRDLGVQAKRVDVVLNGVTRPPPRPVRQEGPPRILFLGRIGDRKGVPELIAALASPELHGRPWHATIAGDGEADRMRRLRDSHGPADRIDMPGWVGRAATSDLLSQADMLVLPSHHEALPVAVIEALSWQVPVITTPVGAVPEILSDDVNALLVTPGDVGALAAAVIRLLDEPATSRRLAQAGHEVFRTRLDAAEMADRVLAIYRLAAARKPGRRVTPVRQRAGAGA